MKCSFFALRALLFFASPEADKWVNAAILSSKATNNPFNESIDFSFPSEAPDDSSPPVAAYGHFEEGIIFFI